MIIPNYNQLNEQIELYENIYNKQIISIFFNLLALKLPATNTNIFNSFQLEELKKNKLFNDLCAYNLYHIILNECQINGFDIIQNDSKLGIKYDKLKICNFVYNKETNIDIFNENKYIDFILDILNLNLENNFKEEEEFDNRTLSTNKVKKLIHPNVANVIIR